MNLVVQRSKRNRAEALPPLASQFPDYRSFAKASYVFLVHVALYAGTLWGALAPIPVWLNVVFAVANGVFIALLFIIGHDAAHGSFVPGRALNRAVARLAFVPCVHAASLWRVIHNQRHHGRTNLKGVDDVWVPMSVEEYRSASPARRRLERVYRSAAGPLIYYYVAFWMHRVLFPLAPEVRPDWKRHLPDTLFALTGFALTLAAIVGLGTSFNPDRSLWLVLGIGWALPFAIWNYLMAFTIYLNHTHPSILWFADEVSWRKHHDVLLDTASQTMPVNLVPLYTKVGAHTVHHVQPKVPVYALLAMQAELKNAGHGIVEYMLSFSEYKRIVRSCKLFDFQLMCWTDFNGFPTAWPLYPEYRI